jgi:hypothetical protein
MKAIKTHYTIDGEAIPCYEVDNEAGVIVRIAPYYHYVGKTTCLLTEFINGEKNSTEEYSYEFDFLNAPEALRLATEFSAYLKH